MVTGVCVEEAQRIVSCSGIDDLIYSREGKGSFGQALLRSLKSTHTRQDLSFFGTITRFASQSGCFMSLINLASNNLASSSPIACLFGSEKRRRACLTGLNPFWMFRLCSAKLRGILGMSEGCQVKISQFSCRNSRSAASTSGFSRAPMEAVLLGFVGWTWNFTISSAGLKDVDLDLLSSITSSLLTVERSAVSSSATKASDSASRANAALLFSARSAMSGSLARVIIPFGPASLASCTRNGVLLGRL